MKKLLLVLFLSVSLVCLSQTTTGSGSAETSSQTAVPAPPQVVPSDVTLPGSGPPVGAPLTNTNTNDARTGGMVQAYNPAAVVEHPVVGSTTELSHGPNSGSEIPFNMGLQSFAGSARPLSDSSMVSLADIARQYRNQAHSQIRTFTNDSIAQLSTGQSLPQGREMAQAQPRDAQREMAMAAAIPPMYASGASQNASSGQVDQQKRTSSMDASQAATGTSGTEAAQAAENAERPDRSNLPASGSELPLLALFGLLVAGGGALYRFYR